MAYPETMAERAKRVAAEEQAKAEKTTREKAEEAAKTLGGLSGKAAGETMSYKERQRRAIEDQTE